MSWKYIVAAYNSWKYQVTEPTTYEPASTVTSTLYWLSGVSGNEVVDRSGNSRNFTISGKDFTTNYLPFKTAATISAPAADATLIAADVNNFLYDTGGTPNDIPIISFFQNIDYEDKLFCKHVVQVLDGNGVETTAPGVTDIVLYSAVLTGADLTLAAAYYVVPSVEATGAYVPGDYTTNTLALAGQSPGDTIYNKTGEITEPANLAFNKALSIIGIGFSKNKYTGTPVTLVQTSADGTHLEGIILDGENAINIGMRNSQPNTVLKRCYLSNVKSGQSMIHELNVGASLTDCVFIGRIDQTAFNPYGGAGAVISGCFFSGKYSQTLFGSDVGSGNEQTIQYCKFVLEQSTTYLIVTNASTYNFNYNDVEVENPWADFFAIQTANMTLNVRRNVFNFTGTTQLTNMFLLFHSFPATGTLNLEYNTYDSVDGIGGLLSITTAKAINIVGNYVRMLSAISDVDITESANYEGNTFRSWSDYAGNDLFAGIVMGSTVEKDLDVVIHKNKVLNPKYVDAGYGGFHGCIYLSNYINAVIKHNYIAGAGIGNLIYKGTVMRENTESPVMYNVSYLEQLLIKAISYTKIYNNTIVNGATAGIHFVVADDLSEIRTCYVKNNIVVDSSGSAPLIDVESEEVGFSHDIDYNIYYSTDATPFEHKGVKKTWVEWQALGYDANSTFLTAEQFTALFTDFDNGDYSLPTGSAAIGAGTDLGTDYDDGLDSTTDWGEDDETPTVVTKQQTGSWDCGAYVS